MKHEREIRFLERLKKSFERGAVGLLNVTATTEYRERYAKFYGTEIERAIQALRSTEPTDVDRIEALEKRAEEQQEAIVWLTNNVFYGSSPGRPAIIRRILSERRVLIPEDRGQED